MSDSPASLWFKFPDVDLSGKPPGRISGPHAASEIEAAWRILRDQWKNCCLGSPSAYAAEFGWYSGKNGKEPYHRHVNRLLKKLGRRIENGAIVDVDFQVELAAIHEFPEQNQQEKGDIRKSSAENPEEIREKSVPKPIKSDTYKPENPEKIREKSAENPEEIRPPLNKRKEDKKNKIYISGADTRKGKRRAKKTPKVVIANDWCFSPQLAEWAERSFPGIPQSAFESYATLFFDACKAGAREYADFDAAFRNWVRREIGQVGGGFFREWKSTNATAAKSHDAQKIWDRVLSRLRKAGLKDRAFEAFQDGAPRWRPDTQCLTVVFGDQRTADGLNKACLEVYTQVLDFIQEQPGFERFCVDPQVSGGTS